MTDTSVPEIFPGGLRQATSVFIAGSSRPLLKWVALALLEPYASRVYWTDIRIEGEEPEPDDPIATNVVSPDRVHVLHPLDLRTDDADVARAEAVAPKMFHSDEPPEAVRRIFNFLRLPEHSQQRIVSTFAGDEPAILVLANAQRLVGVFPAERTGPMVNAVVDAGACIVSLWTEALPPVRSAFDMVLLVEGGNPADWRSAQMRCEKGIASGPLAHGVTVRLDSLSCLASVLERKFPAGGAH
jgi:hypothetical protein